jgi:hypothetical protein
MADNDQSKIRYDDFVSRVQSDAANPQATIMLAGYVGHGPDGHVRIYTDPTLGKWYDVPEADVVHSQPIGNSDLGGSFIWVKQSAAIKPGSSAPAPQAQPQAMAAAAPHPLPQPTPATHCFICPALTHGLDCLPHTHQVRCQTQPMACDVHTMGCPVVTNPAVCGIVPQTLACGAQQQGAAQVHPQAQLFAAAPQAVFQPTPSAVHQCGGQPQAFTQHICPTPSAVQHCGPQPFTQHICPTPSAVQHCGQPPFTQHICPTPSAVHQCGGQPQPFTQHFCPTPSAVHQCGGVTFHLTHCICATPTVTANIACLQTANTACLPITLGGCTPQSIACTPNLTPVQNGVFTPFGR